MYFSLSATPAVFGVLLPVMPAFIENKEMGVPQGTVLGSLYLIIKLEPIWFK